MSNEPARTGRDQLRQVFQFLEQWHIRQVEVIRDWRQHPWRLALSELPTHPDVQLGRVEGDHDDGYVLRVRRPEETPCPSPPASLLDWLQPGWREPVADAEVFPSKNVVVAGDTVTIRFDDDPSRGQDLRLWNSKRESWRIAEIPARQVGALFQRLFELRGRMDRESERLQFVVGQGMLRIADAGGAVEHPILMQRVTLTFDPRGPRFDVALAEDPPELNTSLVRNIAATEAKHLGTFRERIRAGEAHLMDASKTRQLLTEFTHALFMKGRVTDSPVVSSDAAQVYLFPVLMLVPRDTKYTEAIQATIERIESEEELPVPLVGIVGLEPPRKGHSPGATGGERITSPPSGRPSDERSSVRRELLLTRPANEAQERILHQLEATHTVVVQGPPGTGKTHTIGNILGHLLAQGKRVLVASHTPKALRVLRENIVEPLRPLCVSVLDNDAESKRQLSESVHGITTRMSQDSAVDLERRGTRLKSERDRIIADLEVAEQELERAITDEHTALVIAGTAHEPSRAAALIREWGPSCGWIPAPVDITAPVPLPVEDIRELYRLNEEVGEEDEEEIDGHLPDLKQLPRPEELPKLISRERDLRGKNLTVPDDAWLGEPTDAVEPLKAAWQLLKDALREVLQMREQPHLLECMDAGRLGGPQRELWDDFIAFIQGLRRDIERDEVLARRRSVVARVDPIDDRLLATIRELRGSLKHEKTVFRLLARLGKGLHPLWRRVVQGFEVEAKRAATDDDLEAIEAYVRVRVNRGRLVHRWRQHFEMYPSVSATKLGDRPEVACHQHVDQLVHALAWHERHWKEATEALRAAGIDFEAALRLASPRAERFGELNRLIDAANVSVRDWLQKRLHQLELAEARDKFQSWIDRLRRIPANRDVSGLARSMSTALRERDAGTYQAAHERVSMLEEKRSRLERRRQLLGAMAAPAPAWAAAIGSRTNPHDQPVPPGDVERAWTYRQILQELERIAKTDIAVAQRKVSDLRRALQERTSQYVDCLAWARQHRRTGPKERQALQAWLATVNTRGYESGVRSVQLKAQARRLLDQSRSAVPVWIMTVARAVDALDFRTAQFDVVIIDEASQCDMLGMLLLGIAKEAIVVGDDKQVSPSAVGELLNYTQKLIDEYLGGLQHRELFTGRMSLYDMATQSFGEIRRLLEHFRCAEDIISFSNQLCYGGTIRPLRDTSSVQRVPHVVTHHVAVGRRDGDVNETEALEVASLVVAAMEQPEYDGATFGVISMLRDRQALEIEAILRRRVPEAKYEQARLLCGSAPQFQGDERDVVFLSLVDSSREGPLLLRRDPDLEKRYNVAASRGRDQLWVVHSMDPERDLKEGDLRQRLLRHCAQPAGAARQHEAIDAAADSEFERRVGAWLTDRGYRVRPQWKVGSLSIDLVVLGGDGRKIAIECDGDRFHQPEQLKDDLGRQMLLERLGWKFIRIRGTEFFRDSDAVMDRVIELLAAHRIEPIGPEQGTAGATRGRELLERVRRRAAELRRTWAEEDADREDVEDALEVVHPDGTSQAPRDGESLHQSCPSGDLPPDPGVGGRIVHCLQECGRALTRTEIIDRTGLRAEQWSVVLSELLGAKAVVQVGSKREPRYVVQPQEQLAFGVDEVVAQ